MLYYHRYGVISSGYLYRYPQVFLALFAQIWGSGARIWVKKGQRMAKNQNFKNALYEGLDIIDLII